MAAALPSLLAGEGRGGGKASCSVLADLPPSLTLSRKRGRGRVAASGKSNFFTCSESGDPVAI